MHARACVRVRVRAWPCACMRVRVSVRARSDLPRRVYARGAASLCTVALVRVCAHAPAHALHRHHGAPTAERCGLPVAAAARALARAVPPRHARLDRRNRRGRARARQCARTHARTHTAQHMAARRNAAQHITRARVRSSGGGAGGAHGGARQVGLIRAPLRYPGAHGGSAAGLYLRACGLGGQGYGRVGAG